MADFIAQFDISVGRRTYRNEKKLQKHKFDVMLNFGVTYT